VNWSDGGAAPPPPVDTTPPETTIDAGPTGTVTATDATFAFSSNESGSVFECRLDGGSFLPCASPKTYTGLAGGTHTFDVRATDQAGNTDASPATRSWTIYVDTTPPETTITSGPPTSTSSQTATFAFTASETPVTFHCHLENEDFSPCTSPKTYTGLTGTHVFTVRAVDSAGNADASPATYTWTITNDMFAAAYSLGNISNRTTGNNGTATKEPGEPNHAGNRGGKSVWWYWTAPGAGTVTVDTQGSSFDTLLGVYTGTAVSALTTVAANDDYNRNTWSRVQFTASAGTVYRIAVDGRNGHYGSISLGVSFTAATPPDTTPPETTIDSGPSGTTTATDATFAFSSSEPGSTFQCRLDGASFALCGSPKSYSGLAAGTHTFDVRAIDVAGNTDPTPASRSWTISTVTAPPPDTTITSSPPSSTTSTSASFAFTSTVSPATFQCQLDGSAFAACASPTSYTGLAAGSHTFNVRAVDSTGNVDPTPATWTWTITSSSGPANDMFANAQAVSGASGTATGSSVGATKEAGEPNHAGNAGGHSLWYRFTPATSGSVTIDTFGSNFDTLLAAYTGSSVSALTAVAANDDTSGTQSQISFAAVGGTTYQIAVDGYGGATGSVTLHWSQSAGPANDMFANAIALTAASGSVTGTNTGATKETGEPNHAGVSGGHSIWYAWTAPTNVTASVDTFGSSFDTVLAVYTGTSVSALTAVASNDDSGGLQSKVTFVATAGVTYRIAVDGYGGATGSVKLTWG
jgi:hypothetical protein